MVAKMIATVLICAFVIGVSGALEEECNILLKLDSHETRLREQEVSLREYQIRLREQEVSLAEKSIRIGDLELTMTEKDSRIRDLEQNMTEKNTRISDLEHRMTEKHTRISDLEQSMNKTDNRIGNLEQSINEKETRIGDLEQNMTETDTRIGELQNSFAANTSHIKDNLNQQAANINELRSTLTATLNEHTTELANLDQRFGPGRQSAFTARVPLSSGSNLRFTTVVTNIGNDYNSSTGRFKCQYPGLYFFAVSITKVRSSNDAINDLVYVYLRVNGTAKVYAGTDPQDDSDNGSYETSATFVTRLTAGDYVYITGTNSQSMDSKSHFSGYLILPDK